MVVPEYISIVGSALLREDAPVIDVLVKDDPNTPAYWQQSMRVLIQRLLDPAKTGKNLNIMFNPQGAHAGPVRPLLDLVLRRSSGLQPAAYRMQKSSNHFPKTDDNTSDGFQMDVVKAVGEKRYTFSVVYKASVPGAIHLDNHREYSTPDVLQQAQWDYVRKSAAAGRQLYLMHGLPNYYGDRAAGEWVDIAQLPFPVESTFKLPNGQSRKREIPAGSVWMGAIWEPWAWPEIKSGRINGFSFGGTAYRLFT